MTTQPLKPKTIFVVGGPAGSGKTTVAVYLSRKLAVPYVEGDDYHTAANKLKMGSGTPLTDGDRWDWLISLRNAAVKQLQSSSAVIITCSSLRRRYRDVFRVASYDNPVVQVNFIYLKIDKECLQARVAARVGHYMKDNMVRSQLQCLEEPMQDEFDVVKVDVGRDQAVVCTDALAKAQAKLYEDGVDISNKTGI